MTQLWAIRVPVLGLAVAVIAGCGKSDRQQRVDTAAQAPAANVGGGRPAALPGALSQPIDSMSGDQLFDLAHRLNFVGGNERQRRCRGNRACAGPRPTQFVRLRIDAVDQEDSLRANGIPANGVIAARVLNRGQAADSMYGTRPGAYEYYYVIVPATAGGATWRLEEVTTGVPRQHRRIASGRFHECGHPFVRGARADFKTCEQAAAARPAAFGLPQTDGDAPIWIGCAFGCCTADPPDITG